jgi:hypothetical protein
MRTLQRESCPVWKLDTNQKECRWIREDSRYEQLAGAVFGPSGFVFTSNPYLDPEEVQCEEERVQTLARINTVHERCWVDVDGVAGFEDEDSVHDAILAKLELKAFNDAMVEQFGEGENPEPAKELSEEELVCEQAEEEEYKGSFFAGKAKVADTKVRVELAGEGITFSAFGRTGGEVFDVTVDTTREPVKVMARRQGYTTELIAVDGSEPLICVVLEKAYNPYVEVLVKTDHPAMARVFGQEFSLPHTFRVNVDMEPLRIKLYGKNLLTRHIELTGTVALAQVPMEKKVYEVKRSEDEETLVQEMLGRGMEMSFIMGIIKSRADGRRRMSVSA